MSTQNVGQSIEKDIFDVMREIEVAGAPRADRREHDKTSRTDDCDTALDTERLRKSLEDKLRLVEILEGYSEAKGIVEKKQELKEAIEFLDELGLALSDE